MSKELKRPKISKHRPYMGYEILETYSKEQEKYIDQIESKLKEAEEIHTRDMGVIELLKSTLNGFNKLRQ